jgi:hypothetical protein
MSPTRQQAYTFVSSILGDALKQNHDTSRWIIDHLCYRTATQDEYERVVEQLTLTNCDLAGVVISKATVNGRPITSIRLNEPLKVASKFIEVLEIPAPKSSLSYPSGFEHVEVLALEPIVQSELLFDSGKVKFHYLPLSCLITVEEKPELGDWIARHKLMALLSTWEPVFSGSVPLGVDTSDSDLDILLFSKDLSGASQEILQRLHLAGVTTRGTWKLGQCRQGACMTLSIDTGTKPIELFLSTEHPSRQDSHRDLIAEYVLLSQYGDSLRETVRTLKQSGMDTESAFAHALQLPNDWHRKWQVPNSLDVNLNL